MRMRYSKQNVFKGTRKISPWKIAPWKIAPNPNPNPNPRRQFSGHYI